MKSLFYCIVTGLVIISFTSCVKEIDEYQAPDVSATQVTNMNDLLVPSGFNFNLDREVTFEIRLKNNTDGPISKVVVDIMTDIPENNGKVLFRGATNATGIISGKFKALKTLNQFVINTDYIGITNNAVVTVNNNHIQLSLGGSNPQKYCTRISMQSEMDILLLQTGLHPFPINCI
ncbi:MAG: hypothetical protein IPP46_16160 [Bacteroidetes bacterium]|nr:hypothetical protein [Bacteroidota bacterium]